MPLGQRSPRHGMLTRRQSWRRVRRPPARLSDDIFAYGDARLVRTRFWREHNSMSDVFGAATEAEAPAAAPPA
eukprot:CAMPEP_0118870612 /NCGR_PEP_ID=MMETSP1163-20130328/13513_1 /TAXON_ID=124430 /ORGANISM="Phaeomonas parva, Strain CCMP2877" /LENGTH=72 /DNA_ID=CAMNT_0006805631 /DNA_START=37 /DNA_END=251 /DNA_ORIENTATION=-